MGVVYLPLEVSQERKWHSPGSDNNNERYYNDQQRSTNRPAELSAITRYVYPPSEI